MDYLLWLQNLREGTWDVLNTCLYYLSEALGGIFGVIICAVVYWCMDKKAGNRMSMGFAVAYFANQTLKNVCCVYRPSALDSRIRPYGKAVKNATGYSFPSGHTTNATAIFGGMAIWQRKRRWFVVICLIILPVIAFTRNWLGVHTLQDVIVALALASAMLYCMGVLTKFIEKNAAADKWVALGAILLAAIALAFFELKSYPIDYDSNGEILADPFEMKTDCFRSCALLMGFFAGWYIERRWINFDIPSRIKTVILRFVIGLVLVLGLYLGLFPIIFKPLGEHWGKFLKYLFTTLAVTAGYPALFKWFENVRNAKTVKKEEDE